jgi:hypothetical protein
MRVKGTEPPTIEVYAVGAWVVIGGQPGIAGQVTAVSIRAGSAVSYEVVWYDGNTRCCAWLSPVEVTADPGAPWARIGFLSPEQRPCA